MRFVRQWAVELLSSVYVGPAFFVAVLACASAFYHRHNGWEVSTAIYFGLQTLLGCNYGALNHDQLSKEFTLGLYILGTTLVAGAISIFTADMVRRSKGIHEDERKRNRGEFSSSLSPASLGVASLALAWCGLGVCWGMYMEGLTLRAALYFAIGAMSARGDPDPVVECAAPYEGGPTNCNLGALRAAFYCIYCLVGVNLYIICMGRYAGALSELAIRAAEKRLIEQPLRAREYELAMSLRDMGRPGGLGTPLAGRAGAGAGASRTWGSPTSSEGEDVGTIALDVRDFIILEALRLERVDTNFIIDVLELFRRIDKDGNGVLEANDLLLYKIQCLGHGKFDVRNDAGDGGTTSYNALFVPLISTPTPNKTGSRVGEDSNHDEYVAALASPPSPGSKGEGGSEGEKEELSGGHPEKPSGQPNE